MSEAAPAPDLRSTGAIQTGGSHGGGNRILRYEVGGRPALLKVYCRRGSLAREWWKRLSYRLFEGRRGVTAGQRRENERACLRLWRQHGFDVPDLLELPQPLEVPPETSLWIEYCRGRLLSEVLRDEGTETEEKCAHLARLARELGRRQSLALELDESLLVMEHASVKHVILSGDRLVHFDFEAVFAPGASILRALGQELAGLVRSITRHTTPSDTEAVATAFVRAHPSPALLQRIAEAGVGERDVRLSIKRRFDRRRRRGSLAKTDALHWVLEKLD